MELCRKPMLSEKCEGHETFSRNEYCQFSPVIIRQQHKYTDDKINKYFSRNNTAVTKNSTGSHLEPVLTKCDIFFKIIYHLRLVLINDRLPRHFQI